MTSALMLWGRKKRVRGDGQGTRGVCLLMWLRMCDSGGGEGFQNVADDRSGTTCLLIMTTERGWKVLKGVKRKAAFFKLHEILTSN